MHYINGNESGPVYLYHPMPGDDSLSVCVSSQERFSPSLKVLFWRAFCLFFYSQIHKYKFELKWTICCAWVENVISWYWRRIVKYKISMYLKDCTLAHGKRLCDLYTYKNMQCFTLKQKQWYVPVITYNNTIRIYDLFLIKQDISLNHSTIWRLYFLGEQKHCLH